MASSGRGHTSADLLRTLSRAYAESTQNQEHHGFADIDDFDTMNQHTPSDTQMEDEDLSQAFEGGTILDEHDEQNSARPTSTEKASAAAEVVSPKPTTAMPPSGFKTEPLTPPPSQLSPTEPDAFSATQTPEIADAGMPDASQTHGRDIKEDSDGKIKHETSPDQLRRNDKSGLSPVPGLKIEIDLTIDSDSDDEVQVISSKKSPAVDLTQDDNDVLDLANDEEDLFVPQGTDDDDDGLPNLPNIRAHMDQETIQSDHNVRDKEEEDDAFSADGDDMSDFDPEPAQTGESSQPRKRKNQGKPTGPRAKTAREWHRRRNSKIKPSSRQGYAWKKKELSKLKKSLKEFLRKHNARKPNPKRKGFVDPNIFLGGDTDDSDDYEELDLAKLGGDVAGFGTKKAGFLDDFLGKFPELDTHRCKTDWADLKKKSRSFGYDRMQKDGDDRWKLKGMTCRLYNHQMMGSAWMLQRECDLELPNGGIVADDMGVGKTVQALATVVGNPAEPDWDVQATLIVVPPSLKNQWWREIKKHTPKVADRSMIFEKNRIDNSVGKIASSIIVLTTYSEVIKSLPMPDPELVKKWEEDKEDVPAMTHKWIKKQLKKKECGLLHQIRWYRVVIDEAHHIKNPATQLFRAMNALEADHRWCLSGTPVMNNWAEFHSHFRFLKDPLTKDIKPQTFVTEFCIAGDESCRQALGIALSDLIIRRSVKDKVMGLPIVKLPPKIEEVVTVKRYHPERLLYSAILTKLMSFINRDFPKDDECRLLNTYLPQLTRMRQLIAHPQLIGRQIMIILGINGMKQLKKDLNSIKLVKKSRPMAKSLLKYLDDWIKDFNHKCYKNKGVKNFTCVKCGETDDDDLLVINKCSHCFCEACFSDAQTDIQERGNDIIEWHLCPECNKRFKSDDIRPAHEEAPNAKSYAPPKVRKGKDARGYRPALAANQISALRWLKSYDEGRSKGLFASAKLRGTVKQIQQWLSEAPDEKIIVFSQFRMFAILVGLALQKKKVSFIYFSGDMSTKDRDEAIAKMEDPAGPKLMISGLKVGGQGLNFQFSNRSIVTDIWWNKCIDQQALGRTYRMGQDKESVHFHRIVVNKTVDSTIINLQEDKRKAICRIMQDMGAEAEDVLAEILGHKNGEPDNEPDSSDDEGDDSGDEDGF